MRQEVNVFTKKSPNPRQEVCLFIRESPEMRQEVCGDKKDA